ncbi:hypothetical protein [Streptomyces candidus]|uniref:Uncharacterized protein n=1 Tax=Streptomyces candidus TaxID=67283 RepID=A0A7X0HBY5_9ACTN|nr:hypothetical protein [Streptomyces candidus]MBB6434735.1 hypothetical protein [Streptomyces candidus]GHH58188.1 hypothetical protein GCM10018773_66280 [Streptomyces candidus]
MLSVTYELVPATTSGRRAHFSEARGAVRIEVADGFGAPDLIDDLNRGMQEFLDGARWFQLWRHDIIGRTGGCLSLDIKFSLADLEPGDYVEIRESRGFVSVGIERTATAAQFVRAVNPAVANFLDGGQWFQVYGGEIVDNSHPDSMSTV